MSQTQRADGRGTVPENVKAKIPLKRRWPPHQIEVAVVETRNGDREQKRFLFTELPEDAQRAFLKFNGVPQEVREMDSNPFVPGDPSDYPKFEQGSQDSVAACEECGYLTTADAVTSALSHRKRAYTCPNEFDEEAVTPTNGDHTEYGSSEAWNVNIRMDGDEHRLPADADPDYTVEVTYAAEHGYDPEIIGEETVPMPAEDATISGEIDGKEWTAEVTHRDDGTVAVDWHRVGEDGTEYDLAVETRIDEGRECGCSSFQTVYPNPVDEDDYVDVPSLDADEVPNHPSHLGRIKGELNRGLTADEMTEAVEQAIMEFYRKHE